MSDHDPFSIAWENWLMTDEGRQCAAPVSWPLEVHYLRNRLRHAFMAGAKAAVTPSDTSSTEPTK